MLNAGIHKISMADYLADPAPEPSLSSGLAHTLITQSPLHAWHQHPRLNPNYKPEQNSIMDAGSVAHHILLQGDTRNIVVVQANDWRTNAAKEARDQAWATGGIAVLEGRLAEINVMVEVAKKYIAESELAGVFDEGDAEMTMIWQEGKIWCRGRPDWITKDRKIMVDYKTTAASAEPFSWARQLISMGYDMQAFMYSRGLNVLTGIVPKFIFLVQENEPPYACSLIGCDPSLEIFAERRCERAIALWQQCIESGKWPGYPNRIAWADAPEWATRQWEERQIPEQNFELGGQP